ncbi:hypothetical protein [Alkalihalobacillus sp. BA299]|uniref:hypothetical protein n=1 Tax=Alkalihalobacillus sp. BA299 TaxID=2815938 RepID=UPI001ADCB554|nr:hypothetical protein [Alkalihalobacillus sp. BA299]
MVTNYTVFVPTEVKRKQEKYNMEELFKNPLIHRQISGDEIYIPLDTKRLWGF